ncbi:MAG: FxsA family protein [Gemmobacter sp.]
MWFFLAILLVPLIEIGLFIEIGGWIGLWPTLLWVVASTAAGLAAMRAAGAQTLAQVKAAMDGLRDPARPLADGALRLAGAALLVLPGFLTDAIGLALLVAPVRALLLQRIARARGGGTDPRKVVIDAEYRDVTPRDPSDRLR